VALVKPCCVLFGLLAYEALVLHIWEIYEGVTILTKLSFVRLLPPVNFVNSVTDRDGNGPVLVKLSHTPLQKCGQHCRTLKQNEVKIISIF
jgi:hypothetical protein